MNRIRQLRRASVALLLLAACDNDPVLVDVSDTAPPSLTAVTALDRYQITASFNQKLDRSSAENPNNYLVGEVTPSPTTAAEAPTARIPVEAVALSPNGKTVFICLGSPMDAVPHWLSVLDVSDVNGNFITSPATRTFAGSAAADENAPKLVFQSPLPDATEVPVRGPLTIVFSERIPSSSFYQGFEWNSGFGPVEFSASSDDGGMHVYVTPDSPLQLGTTYQVTLSGIQDFFGNTLADATWTFTTIAQRDDTPPQLVASTPADGATDVSIHTNLVLEFSEPIDATELGIELNPPFGEGYLWWTNDGRTMNYDPDDRLDLPIQYTLTIMPGGVRDLNGNRNEESIDIRFTTAGALAAGSVAGLVTGDPESGFASDPAGALVVAVEGGVGSVSGIVVAGSAIAGTDGAYAVQHLPDGTYTPFALVDSNADGVMDPAYGDAFGILGMDIAGGDFSDEAVLVAAGATVADADFPLYDPSALTGRVMYAGAHADLPRGVKLGLWDAAGFDPQQPPAWPPAYAASAFWPFQPEWQFIDLDLGFPDGTYYLGAFFDVNQNNVYDPGLDPFGYRGGAMPQTVTILDGSDINDIEILIVDAPPAVLSSSPVTWPESRATHASLLSRVSRVSRAALGAAAFPE